MEVSHQSSIKYWPLSTRCRFFYI